MRPPGGLEGRWARALTSASASRCQTFGVRRGIVRVSASSTCQVRPVPASSFSSASRQHPTPPLNSVPVVARPSLTRSSGIWASQKPPEVAARPLELWSSPLPTEA